MKARGHRSGGPPMRNRFRPGRPAALALLLLPLAGTAVSAADPEVPAAPGAPAAGSAAVTDTRAQAKCEEKADERQLTDKARERFMGRCVERVAERQASRQQARGQLHGPGRVNTGRGGTEPAGPGRIALAARARVAYLDAHPGDREGGKCPDAQDDPRRGVGRARQWRPARGPGRRAPLRAEHGGDRFRLGPVHHPFGRPGRRHLGDDDRRRRRGLRRLRRRVDRLPGPRVLRRGQVHGRAQREPDRGGVRPRGDPTRARSARFST